MFVCMSVVMPALLGFSQLYQKTLHQMHFQTCDQLSAWRLSCPLQSLPHLSLPLFLPLSTARLLSCREKEEWKPNGKRHHVHAASFYHLLFLFPPRGSMRSDSGEGATSNFIAPLQRMILTKESIEIGSRSYSGWIHYLQQPPPPGDS